jgi:hypothetical protein
VADGLLEAFGDDSWSGLGEAALLVRLEAAQPPAGPRGGRRPRYAASDSGGVLECVIGLGYDDAADGGVPPPRKCGQVPSRNGGANARARVRELAEAFRMRGYSEGPAAAAPLLEAIGRPCPDDPVTTYFARADGAHLAPPAAPGRDVGVVVRIVANGDGRSGHCAAAAFSDGLRHAGLCLYVGHWRYGLGPDFDRGPAIEVRDGDLPADPGRLARAATIERRRRAETFDAVLDRWLDEGRIAVADSPETRVTLAHDNLLPRDPLARLIHWTARRAEPGGTADLLAPDDGPPHRIWALVSCRSAGTFPALRAVLPASAVRLVGLRGMASLDSWRRLPWVLDTVRAGGTWSELIAAVDGCGDPDGVVVDGWHEDPWIP